MKAKYEASGSGRLRNAKLYIYSISTAIILSCLTIFMTISLAPPASEVPSSVGPLAVKEAQAAPGACKVKKTYFTQRGEIPLRWGDSKFGYRHNATRFHRHPNLPTAIGYVLNYGRTIRVANGKEVVRGWYAGRQWQIVWTWQKKRCGTWRKYGTGVISARRHS